MGLISYVKTVWQDRAVQFPNRYDKSLETSGSVTLIQNPGVVTQAGTAVNATRLNNIEQGIYNAQDTANKAKSVSKVYAQQNLGGF